jgi:hypothetical protein
MRTALLGLVLSVLLLGVSAGGVAACPTCSEAVPSTTQATDDDQTREAAAYNQSIYLMVGMPYLLLSLFGFFLYRSMRKRMKSPSKPEDAGFGREQTPYGKDTSLNENGNAITFKSAGVR